MFGESQKDPLIDHDSRDRQPARQVEELKARLLVFPHIADVDSNPARQKKRERGLAVGIRRHGVEADSFHGRTLSVLPYCLWQRGQRSQPVLTLLTIQAQ